jgi:hypothetical protein
MGEMKKHLQTFLSLAWIMIGIAICPLSACQRHPRQAIERPFRATQLLITASDMPAGWKLDKVSNKNVPYMGGLESAYVLFVLVNQDNGPNFAGMGVFRYRDIEGALEMFKLHYQGFGDVPLAWHAPQLNADQIWFGCVNRPAPSPPACIWAAIYEEYLVEFTTPLLPGYMTLDDLARVVAAIDNKMARYIGTLKH